MESAVKQKSDVTVGEKDELSKAEARAKRKEAKKNKKEKKETKSNETKSDKPSKLEKSKNVIAETKSCESIKEKKSVVENNITATRALSTSNHNDGLSKTDLKPRQDAQKCAKATAKTENKTCKDISKIEKNISDSQNKDTNKNEKIEGESKSELKAKRRAMQEAQRQAKEKAKLENEKVQSSQKKVQTVVIKVQKVKVNDNVVSGTNAHKKLQLFHHLYDLQNSVIHKKSSFSLHSAIIRLGAQYMSHTVLGSNARCLALLSAIKQLVIDYRTPPNEEFCRSLENNLQLSTNYLQKCRPLAVSMTNALRHIKLHLTQISNNYSDEEKKNLLLEGIDTYIRDEIGMADKAISLFMQAKIVHGDVILIYGCSSIVRKVLLDAHEQGNGKSFKVIVVDSRPLLEGREMLRKLVNAGIQCSYVLINAVSYIMGKATKVLLGAHSLLANGYVMSRAGTAQIALIARSYNKPVLVCCETYKFCERVQTDSIVHNEIGDPDKVINLGSDEESVLKDWKNSKYVTPLNLMYDVTPPDLVTAVVTELAILPCTSVPVILRIKPTEIAV